VNEINKLQVTTNKLSRYVLDWLPVSRELIKLFLLKHFKIVADTDPEYMDKISYPSGKSTVTIPDLVKRSFEEVLKVKGFVKKQH
jgi:hypothetical protein